MLSVNQIYTFELLSFLDKMKISISYMDTTTRNYYVGLSYLGICLLLRVCFSSIKWETVDIPSPPPLSNYNRTIIT